MRNVRLTFAGTCPAEKDAKVETLRMMQWIDINV